jgi:KUP system potassium uptake protein
MPPLKVGYTSVERKSQIYIASVNWSLLIAVLFIMLIFKESSSLAAAYGLAVTGDMTITGIMMAFIFYLKKKPLLSFISCFVAAVDMLYFSANFYKIPHGGYWSLILASIPLAVILINTAYSTAPRIGGTALFLLKDIRDIPPYITQTMFSHGIMYDDNIFISIMSRSDPFGAVGFFKEDIAKGLRSFEIQAGYMELISAEDILRKAGIKERAVYYGLEDISAENPVWKIFSLIKKVMPTFIKFYEFSPEKLHGVVAKVKM